VVIGHGLHEYDFCTGIFCDLLDLEFPEMGCLNLDLTAGNGNDAILGGLDTLAYFLAFTHIEFHGPYLHATASPTDLISVRRGCGSDIPIGLRGLIPLDGDKFVS
jgi:hypothetical protein